MRENAPTNLEAEISRGAGANSPSVSKINKIVNFAEIAGNTLVFAAAGLAGSAAGLVVLAVLVASWEVICHAAR